MRLHYDSSFKRGRVEFIAVPGMEIEVPDELGKVLLRQDERWKEGKAPKAAAAEPTPEPAAEPTSEEPAEAPATTTRRSRRTKA